MKEHKYKKKWSEGKIAVALFAFARPVSQGSLFSIFLPKQNQFIGYVGLKNINLVKRRVKDWDCSWRKKFWRKVIRTRAALEILEYSKKLGLNRIVAEIQKRTLLAKSFFTKLGFIKKATKQRDSLHLVLDLW